MDKYRSDLKMPMHAAGARRGATSSEKTNDPCTDCKVTAGRKLSVLLTLLGFVRWSLIDSHYFFAMALILLNLLAITRTP